MSALGVIQSLACSWLIDRGPDSPLIFTINSQCCVDIWFVAQNFSYSKLPETLFGSPHFLLISEVFSVHTDDIVTLLLTTVTFKHISGSAWCSTDHCFGNSCPGCINLRSWKEQNLPKHFGNQLHVFSYTSSWVLCGFYHSFVFWYPFISCE